MLHTASARVGGLDLGFVPGEGGRDTAAICAAAGDGSVRLLYLLGADEVAVERSENCFVVYQGHHGDAGARIADVILPGAAYTEKHGTLRQPRRPAATRLSGDRAARRCQRGLAHPARSLRRLGKPLAYDTLDELRARMVERAPTLAAIDRLSPAPWGEFGTAGTMEDAPFACPIGDFYLTDPITRASQTMTECSAAFVASAEARADG